MADEFDPFKAGATAVDEPTSKEFDPFAAGAIPVEAPRKSLREFLGLPQANPPPVPSGPVADTGARDFLGRQEGSEEPPSLTEFFFGAHVPTGRLEHKPDESTAAKIAKSVANVGSEFVSGLTPSMVAAPLPAITAAAPEMVKGDIERIKAAEKTPDWSPERIEAGLSTVAQIAGLAAGAREAFKPAPSLTAHLFPEETEAAAPATPATPETDTVLSKIVPKETVNESTATPEWLRQNNAALAAVAEKSGVADQIEDLHAQRFTAGQIANQLGVGVDIVRAVRSTRGLPERTDAVNFGFGGGSGPAPENSEFTKWVETRAGNVRPEEIPPAASADAPSGTSTQEPLQDIPPEAAQSISSVKERPDQSEMIRGLATRAREMFGPGAADAGEFAHLAEQNAREYAAIGAAHLLEGSADKASWAVAMRQEYGVRDASPTELNKIWRDSHDLLADFDEAQTGKAVRPKRQIEEATGVRPTTGPIKERLADSISKAQGLGEYLRGMEKGGALGAKAREQQLRLADKWMSADQEQVRQHLTEFVNKTLPPAERGRFIGVITKALTRPDLVKGDPTTMYRNAFRVMQAIDNRTEDVYRGNIIEDLKKVSGRILDSPTVDLAAKRILQRTLSEINLRTPQKGTIESLGKTRDFLNRMEAEGKDVVMPKRVLESLEQLTKTPVSELPTTTLEDLQTKVRLTEKIGHARFETRGAAWDAEKAARMEEIKAGDGTPLELREMFRPQPGEKLSFDEKVKNWIARRFNNATVFDMGHLPMDVHFDLLQNAKGTYTGPLFEHIRNPIDAAYDRAQRRAISELDPLRSLIKKNKLRDTDETQIGLWAQLQQEGGEQRAVESGVTKETIDKLKASGLTTGQKEAYDYMRTRLDATLPEVQALMHDLFNIDVEAVENYFPWMREFETFKPSADRPVFDARTGDEVSPEMLESFGQIAGDFTLPGTIKLERGFTIDRVSNAKTPIRMDAFDVFQRHMYSASRLLEMQRDLKMVGEIIRNDAFAEKFGTYGQKTLNEWVTTTATDGRGGNVHRMPLLDMARKAANRSLVFFRLSSNIKHLSAIPQGIVNAGGSRYYYRGLHAMFTKEGKAFLENFPQVTERQAGDMSLQELQTSLGSEKSGIFPKGLALADRYGFVLGKEIDALNSRTVFLGRYLSIIENERRGVTNRTLKRLGEPAAAVGLTGPIDQIAAGRALVFMRRTVSSTLMKDVQPVLGRGQGFGGNVSLARTVNAFRQYALERWSLMRYDVPKAFESGNYTRGVALILSLIAAGLYETNITGAVRHATGAMLGDHEKDKEKEHETWMNRLMVDSFSMVPYASNAVSAIQWGQSGIPIVDNFVNVGKTAKRFSIAKTPEGKKSAAIGAVGAAAQLGGVPGAGVVTSLAKDALVDKEKIKSQARDAAREKKSGDRSGSSEFSLRR